MTDGVPREDIEATLAVRQEMGSEMDAALVDSLAAKVDAVVERRLAQRAAPAPASPSGARLALAIVSLGAGIPITAMAVSMEGLPGLLVVWVGIVLVNLIFGLGGQGHR